MRFFANKSPSILTIKKRNKEFAKWWEGWVVRVHRARARNNSAGIEGEDASEGTGGFSFRNRLRWRKILEERGL